MKRLGVIGGMSWESTQTYYRLLNEEIKAHCGPLHSAPLLLWNMDFAPIARLQAQGDWAGLTTIMEQAAQGLRGLARMRRHRQLWHQSHLGVTKRLPC